MAKHRYAWRGVDRRGQVVTGETHAESAEDVPRLLREQRIRATRVRRQFELPTKFQYKVKPRASARDITQFTRQLATLLHAGVPLLQAFGILDRGETNPTLKAIIRELHAHIEGGMALNQALRQHAEFDALYCDLVAVGELAGMLDTMLARLAHHLEKSENLRSTIRSALVYPSAVLTIASIVLILILVFVVPAFQNIFASFGAELPWLTRWVIALSESIQHYGIWLLAFLTIHTWWFTQQIKRRTHWRRYLHRLLLRIPIAGPHLGHLVCSWRTAHGGLRSRARRDGSSVVSRRYANDSNAAHPRSRFVASPRKHPRFVSEYGGANVRDW